jgi:hypothetical protein
MPIATADREILHFAGRLLPGLRGGRPALSPEKEEGLEPCSSKPLARAPRSGAAPCCSTTSPAAARPAAAEEARRLGARHPAAAEGLARARRFPQGHPVAVGRIGDIRVW